MTDPRIEVAERVRDRLVSLTGEPLPKTIIPRKAGYTFDELYGWHERLIAVFSIDGVVLTDIDESQNRLVVGVESLEELQGPVEQAVREEGIPGDAFIILEVEPITGE